MLNVCHLSKISLLSIQTTENIDFENEKLLHHQAPPSIFKENGVINESNNEMNFVVLAAVGQGFEVRRLPFSLFTKS